MSNNIGRTEVAAGQNQKEVTINDSDGRTDAALTESLTSDYASADVTLTDSQFQTSVNFKSTNLTVARALNVPAIKKFFIVDNMSGTATLTVTQGTTTIILSATATGLFYTDGVANGLVQTGGDPTNFLALADTPSSYSGQSNKIVTVNGGGTALEFQDTIALAGSITVGGDISPEAIITSSLGALSKAWKTIFIQPVRNDTPNITNASLLFKGSAQTYWFQTRASGQDIMLCSDSDGVGGTPIEKFRWTDDGFFPGVTEVLDLGSTVLEWDNIFLQNAPTVSDKRKKNDLGSAASLIPLMKILDPRIFSRKSKVVKEAIPEHTLQRQKTEKVQEEQTSIKIIDGKPVQITELVDVVKPIFITVIVHDESGKIVKKKTPELDKEGNPTGKTITRSLTHQVPLMEDYTVPAVPEVTVPHGRPHTGFMAQDVKKAMTALGIDDWAGYAYHNEDNEDTHVLRYLEFISPMLAYSHHLEERIEKLEKI